MYLGTRAHMHLAMATESSKSQIVITAFLALLFTFASLVTVVAVSILLPIYKLVQICAKIFRPDLGPIISDLTAAFTLNPQDECAANLANFLILDGNISTERFSQLFHERIIECKRVSGEWMFGRFRYAWTEFLGYTFWKPEKNFSVRSHIREYDLKGELSLPVPCYEKDIRRIIGPITALPWDSDRSPWEVLLTRTYKLTEDDANLRTVVLLRAHHALIDGYGYVTLMRKLTQCKYTMPGLNFQNPPLWFKLMAAIKVPWDMAKMCVATHDGLKHWHVRPSGQRDFSAGMTGAIPISSVKAIKNNLGVSYTTVLFAAVAGAIEKLSQMEKLGVPKNMGVYAPLPMPEHPGGTVNHVVLMGMKWPIKSVSGLERMTYMEKMLTEVKSSTVPLIGSLLAGAIGLIPTSIRRVFLFKFFLAGGTAVVSCFPPTPDTIHLDGVKIHDQISCVGSLGQLSMTILITGINGNQHVVVSGDKRIFPPESFQRIGTYIEEELNYFLPKSRTG